VAARDLAPRVVLVGASLGAIAVLRYAVDDPDLAGVVTVSAPARWRLHSPRAALAAVLTRTGPGRRLARRLGARLDRRWRWTERPDALAARLHRAGTATAGGRAHGAPRRLLVVPDMGHAYCTRGLDAVADAVGWCLAAAPQGRPA